MDKNSQQIHQDEQALLTGLLKYNDRFVSEGLSAPYRATKKPGKHLAIVACMDTRLITMLTAALGLANGEAVIIKVAGAEVNEPYGSVIRSLLVAVYELGVTDIMVIAHTECGAQHMNAEEMTTLMKQAGIDEQAFESVAASGIDLKSWLKGFGDTTESVQNSVATIKQHPLMPSHLNVHGFIIETQTGQLMPVKQK